MRYFISDLQAGAGWRRGTKSVADDLTPDKERVLLRLFERIADERGRLYVVGDLFDHYACSTYELISGNAALLRALMRIIAALIPGNHDPIDLTADWCKALHYTGQRHWEFDGYPVIMEHGHAGDPGWQRGWAVKWAAKGLYWTEGHLWGGADEWLAAQWHGLQSRARKKANESDALPYWWRAEELARAYPWVKAVVLGHSHRQGMSVLPSGKLYVNTGTCARDDEGRERLDVTTFEAGVWSQCQATELT